MDPSLNKPTLKANLDKWYFLRWHENGREVIFLSRGGRWGIADEAAYFESSDAAMAASKRAYAPPDRFNQFSTLKVRDFIRQYRPLLWDLLDA